MAWIAKSTLSWIQLLAIQILKTGHVPKHIAIIMDGNRRYANKIGVKNIDGHSKGFDKLSETLQWCLDFGIPEVTVYAFSIENLKRTKEEVDTLMDLARQKLKKLLKEKEKLKEHGVCIRIIGNLALVPRDVCKLMTEAMTITKKNNKTFLNIAFSYSSRDEITNAVKDCVKGVKDGKITINDIDEKLITKCLYTYRSRDLDLLIRTSGEVRLSDFLMWQTTNACLYFTSVLWPEFSAWNLISAVFYYQRCYSDLVKVRKDCDNENNIVLNDRTSDFINELYRKRELLLVSTNKTLKLME